MNIKNLFKKNRSYRRFIQDQPVSTDTLYELIELARLSASSGNIQGLKFYLSNTDEKNKKIFSTLKWANYIKEWDGPKEGEQPAAYVIILGDTEIHKTIEVDVGIAAQSIMLGAAEIGLGGCMIASIDRISLRKMLNLSDRFQIPLVIALGVPAEQVIIEEMKDDSDVEYWRDSEGIHHVPKRKLEDLIIQSTKP
jgi:nitroreductase